MMYGVDVSEHNGDVNYDLLRKNGNEFVIIRAGYGFSLTQKDKMFERNYELAKASGLKVGIYWYSLCIEWTTSCTRSEGMFGMYKK